MSDPKPVEKKPIRLDKWLKFSRICKTRALAARACDDSQVKVNGRKAKPAKPIQIGDEITIKKKRQYRTFDVLDIVYKSISSKDAKSLYREHKVEVPKESQELFQLLQQWDTKGKRKFKGRPTKKERREMDKLKDS